MSISLVKGQKVDITKGTSISHIAVGLGWDPISHNPVKQVRERGLGNFISNLIDNAQSGSGRISKSDMDIDASAIIVKANGLGYSVWDIVYFGQTSSKDGSIQHSGDNLTGAGKGDDETILVNLSTVPHEVDKIVFVVNIYDCRSRQQTFGGVTNAYIRVYDRSSNKELLRYNLTDDYSKNTGIFVGELYRRNGEWKFGALGEGTTDGSIQEMARRYL